MRTTFHAKSAYMDILQRCVQELPQHPVRPERFIWKMKHNKGCISMMTGGQKDPDGLEWKNPVIVALGDSVTAGHFESLLPENPEELARLMQKAQEQIQAGLELPPIEITDSRECYLEKFRAKLIDKYEQTSVSAINAGIAGDSLIGMSARLERDVLRYQPDLVIINGSLNWSEELGTTAEYQALLDQVVQRIQERTDADIILLTPNGDLPNRLFSQGDPLPTKTDERAEAIRQVALKRGVCLADTYRVWEMARERGCPWEELLANRINHPSVEGHEVYAQLLMKLMEE